MSPTIQTLKSAFFFLISFRHDIKRLIKIYIFIYRLIGARLEDLGLRLSSEGA